MPDWGEVSRELFSSSPFMPHGHCYLWRPGLVWLEVGSNLTIGVAYLAISTTLAAMVFKIRDLPFKLMYLAFGVFIVTCGVTHFFDAWTVWTPMYWVDGGVRALTAVASVGTAVFLPPLVPKAVALAQGAQAAHDRGIKLETAVRDLESMYTRTRELEQLKTQLFAGVSHELRTPLTLVLGPTSRMLARGGLAEEDRRDLELVVRNARVLLKHVNDLLDVAKLEAGRVSAEYSAFDLATETRLVAANFESLARERGTRLTVVAPESLWVEADEDKVRRVLYNLLSNAFKFTPREGHVRVEVAEDGARNEVRLAVGDSGPGIPEASREAVFERFRQLDGGATRAHGGTGLGLSIARELVALQGGTIAASDAPEGGALFTVRLPRRAPKGAELRDAKRPTSDATALAAEQAIAELRPSMPVPAPTREATPAANAATATVLVVEDNREMNRYVSGVLARDHRVLTAFDGEEGLEKARAERPDLVVTDVMMPRASGDELVRAIRADETLDGVAILVLSAKADEEARVRFLREGAQDYLMKPFDAEELRARAGNLVSMRRTRAILREALDSRARDVAALAAELAERSRELRVTLDLTRAAQAQAEAANASRAAFLSVASHELRTPITALQLQVERLARQKALPADLIAVVARMRGSMGRLVELVESLLHFATLDEHAAASHVEPVDVDALVERTVDELRPRAAARGLTLTAVAGEDAPPLTVDRELLRRVLVHLIGNAIKFTTEGSVTVRSSYDAATGERRLEVTDTGPGIAAEDRARVFEPFEHLEPVARKHTPGVGVGLTMARELVRAAGGRIDLESEVGRGSTFRVVLPSRGEA